MPPNSIKIPVVGGTSFNESGIAHTVNLFVKDGFLIPFPTYKKLSNQIDEGEGREIFYNSRINKIFFVIGRNVFISNEITDYQKIDQLQFYRIGSLETSSGNIHYAINMRGDVLLTDSTFLYLAEHDQSTVKNITVKDTIPIHVSYHNGAFIFVDSKENVWRLSDYVDPSSFPYDGSHVGVFNEPDKLKAVVPMVSRGDLINLYGSRVMQVWNASPTGLFPYQKVPTIHHSAGLLAPYTLSSSSHDLVWLGQDSNGQILLYSSSEINVQPINLSGFYSFLNSRDFLSISKGFHVVLRETEFYVLQLEKDKTTLICDLNNNVYYFIEDDRRDQHPAIGAVNLNGWTIFLGRDGKIYEWDVEDGISLTRERLTGPIYFPQYSINSIKIPVLCSSLNDKAENKLNISVSKDGNRSFSLNSTFDLSDLSRETMRVECLINGLGYSNMLSVKLTLNSDKAVLSDGILL